MGASSSVDLRPEEVAELQDLTSYEPKEIKVLYKRFRRLDRGGRGTISLDDLTMIPEIAMNPLSPRLAVHFERDAEDRINFKSFATALATFSDKSDPEAKCRAAFRMFDVDGDGYITRDDLARLLDLMVGRAMTPEAVEQVLRQTIAETDADGDGRISFDDFEQRASLSSSQWRHFTVPIKASMR